MQRATWVGLALVLLTVAAARAADFEEYARLVGEADAAHEALTGASADDAAALRDAALQLDLAVIEWLDAFFASDDFAALPPEQQGLAVRDRYRNEYNAARLFIELDRCAEARDRVRSLLDSSVNDPELRPRLTETYEQALTCLSRPRVATLRVDARPDDAELLVDGEFVGLASSSHTVALGAHQLDVRAEGYASEALAFEARVENEVVEVGPVVLLALGAATSSRSPNAAEWTLWGVGAAGLGTGLVLFLAGADRQSQLDDLEGNNDVVPVDPDGEQSTADSLKLVGIVVGSVGLAAAITGTILFLTRSDDSDERGVSLAPTLFGDSPGLTLTIGY